MIWMLFIPPVPGDMCSQKNADYAEVRYYEHVPICRRNVSFQKKNDICKRDGINDRSEYTVDHIIPLSLGGSNSDLNLWCQHKSIAVTDIEFLLYRQLSSGEISHRASINLIRKIKYRNK